MRSVRTIIKIDPSLLCIELGAGNRELGTGTLEPGTGNWELGTGKWEPGAQNPKLGTGSSTTEIIILLEWLVVWVRTIIEIDPPLFRIVCQHAHSHEICFSTKGETETMQYNISIQSLQDRIRGKIFSEVEQEMYRKTKD